MTSPSARAEVAAIVPAFNEEKTVGAVVRVLKSCPSIGEVIVVSDGSTDRTADEARAAGADRVLHLPVNKGKGGAMRHAASFTDAAILFFCDADLLGFKPGHAEAIIRPVAEGKLAMCVGLRDRGPMLTALEAYLPLISGERALRRKIFDAVPDRHLSGFGVEVALNYVCRANRLPYGAVPEKGLRLVRKMQKVGVLKGLVGYVSMSFQILRTMIAVRLDRNAFLHE
jgi:glycosyltransferase involved in cell wall biosynthesis